MNAKQLVFFAGLALGAQGVVAQQATPRTPLAGECVERLRTGIADVNNGNLREAEIMFADAFARSKEGPEPSCAGLALGQLALVATLSGRSAEAETFAERAIRTLEKIYPQDDPALLRPLRLLAGARFEQGKTTKALEALKRLESIRTEAPGDRALIDELAAVLLQAAGKHNEAESKYLKALAASQDSGRGNSADVGVLLTSLGSLYIAEGRLGEAQQNLARALSIFTAVGDSVPMDLINLFRLRGVLYARQKDWGGSEADLRSALSLADREPGIDRIALRSILANLAYVLRKNHHGREARAIQTRAESLGASRTDGLIVDISELRRGGRRR